MIRMSAVVAELPRAPKAPAGGASIAIKLGKSIKPRKFGYDVMSSVRPYVRTSVRPYVRTSVRPYVRTSVRTPVRTD